MFCYKTQSKWPKSTWKWNKMTQTTFTHFKTSNVQKYDTSWSSHGLQRYKDGRYNGSKWTAIHVYTRIVTSAACSSSYCTPHTPACCAPEEASAQAQASASLLAGSLQKDVFLHVFGCGTTQSAVRLVQLESEENLSSVARAGHAQVALHDSPAHRHSGLHILSHRSKPSSTTSWSVVLCCSSLSSDPPCPLLSYMPGSQEAVEDIAQTPLIHLDSVSLQWLEYHR